MKNNYLMLNGQKINFTAEQLEGIRKCLGTNTVKLSDKAVGDIAKIGEWEFIVLDRSKEETTALLMKGLYADEVKFGKNNDYRESNVRKILDEFTDKLCDIVGEENVIEHTVDLTSDDGLKDYGTIKAKASLLTCDLYRRYVYTIDKHKLDRWWWLATPYSTPTHGDTSLIKCVSPLGYVCNYGCGNHFGVRPFCILNSDIFVS